MVDVILFGTPKRASIVQRRVRSTESYVIGKVDKAYQYYCSPLIDLF